MVLRSTKLNLGCGRDIRKGYVNIDIVKLPGVDKVVNLEKLPYPFADNTFELVESHHVFEHLDNFVGCMEEISRICKRGAIVKMSVPYFASPAYSRDVTHKRKFNLDTIGASFTGESYLSKARVSVLKRKLFYFSCRSFMKSRWYSLPIDLLINLAPAIYERFFVYMLPASEMHMILRIEKPSRVSTRK